MHRPIRVTTGCSASTARGTCVSCAISTTDRGHQAGAEAGQRQALDLAEAREAPHAARHAGGDEHRQVQRDDAEHDPGVVGRPRAVPALEAEPEQVGDVPARGDHEAVDHERQRTGAAAAAGVRRLSSRCQSIRCRNHRRSSSRRSRAPEDPQVAAERGCVDIGRRQRAACAAARPARIRAPGRPRAASSSLSSRNSERRQVGDAGPHRQHLLAQLRRVQRHVARHLGARADQAHRRRAARRSAAAARRACAGAGTRRRG